MTIGGILIFILVVAWVAFILWVALADTFTVHRRMARAHKRIRKNEAKLELLKAKDLYNRNKK